MPEETDYHGWVKPDPGQDNWQEAYYNLLDTLDARTPIPGPVSDRPETAPDGALWYATDEELLYQYDADAGEWDVRGTHWQDYELVFDDETPQTNKYIRFVHEGEQ